MRRDDDDDDHINLDIGGFSLSLPRGCVALVRPFSDLILWEENIICLINRNYRIYLMK